MKISWNRATPSHHPFRTMGFSRSLKPTSYGGNPTTQEGLFGMRAKSKGTLATVFDFRQVPHLYHQLLLVFRWDLDFTTMWLYIDFIPHWLDFVCFNTYTYIIYIKTVNRYIPQWYNPFIGFLPHTNTYIYIYTIYIYTYYHIYYRSIMYIYIYMYIIFSI